MYRLVGLLVVASAACSSSYGASTTPDPDAGNASDSAADDASLADTAVPDVFDGDAGESKDAFAPDAQPRAPNALCVRPDKTRAGMSFSLSPSSPGPGVSLQVTVQEASQGFTNVELLYCTPDTPTAVRVQNPVALAGAPPFRWQFPPMSLPAGITQLVFRADPSTTTYATTRITIQ